MTYIRRMKRGGKYCLCEYRSVREGKKVRSVFVRYLGMESEEEKVPLPKKILVDWKPPDRSVRTGDVTILWRIAEELHIVETIDRICNVKGSKRGNTPGKLLTIWAINRALDPASATQLESWIETSDLPELAKLSKKGYKKDAFLTSLDHVYHQDEASGRPIDNIKPIDEMLYSIWRNNHPLPKNTNEILAYDMTSLIIYGNTCPLANKGYNAEEGKHQQINLSLLVSKYDQHPLAHQVHPGNFSSMTTMQELMPRISDFAIKDGTIIWDRGNTSKKTVTTLERLGWKVICGVPKISREVKEIVENTNIPETPDNLVPCNKTGELYAVKVRSQMLGKMREVVIYRNVSHATRSLVKRNKAIFEISEELKHLKEELQVNSQRELHIIIVRILGGWSSFFVITFPEDEKVVDFQWSIKQQRLETARAMDGKYLLYSTDETLTAKDVVQMYLEKDFIEKAFRCLKTEEELKPVRHHLETRVRAYIFVCTLAFRLLSALRWTINSSESEKVTLSMSEFLKKLGRVDRLEVELGNEVESFHVNLTKDVKDQLVGIGMKDLLLDRRCVKV